MMPALMCACAAFKIQAFCGNSMTDSYTTSIIIMSITICCLRMGSAKHETRDDSTCAHQQSTNIGGIDHLCCFLNNVKHYTWSRCTTAHDVWPNQVPAHLSLHTCPPIHDAEHYNICDPPIRVESRTGETRPFCASCTLGEQCAPDQSVEVAASYSIWTDVPLRLNQHTCFEM